MLHTGIPLQPLLLLGLLACHVLAPWAPVAAQTPSPAAYDPRTKDWASVIAACREIGNQEKRIMNFMIRASFHDSLATDINCDVALGYCGAAGRPPALLSALVHSWGRLLLARLCCWPDSMPFLHPLSAPVAQQHCKASEMFAPKTTTVASQAGGRGVALLTPMWLLCCCEVSRCQPAW
jgi:hypothetical protein